VTKLRINHERLAIDVISARIQEVSNIKGIFGQSSGNRFSVLDWNLPPLQSFQFGDLRYELPDRTVVIEIESAGGVTNLVKYWPYLREKPGKFFILLHVFHIQSSGDYMAHRKLWDFTVDRMREDLKNQGIEWAKDWVAFLKCYRDDKDLSEIGDFVTRLLGISGQETQ